MKKTLALFCLAFISYTGICQQVIGGFNSPTFSNIGATYTVKITNRGTNPATFFIPDQHPGREAITYNDSAFMEYVSAIIARNVSVEDQQEAVADSLAAIVKSEMVVHGPAIFNQWLADSLKETYNKKLSTMGSIHGQWSRKCGDQCTLFATLLHNTGLFNDASSIRDIEFDSLHSLVAVKIRNAYKLYDVDVATPFLNIPFSGSPNGYAAPDDLTQNPGLIDSAPYWYSKTAWGDSMRLTLESRQDYKQLWSQNIPANLAWSMYPTPQNVEGWITLCAGCSMQFTHKVPYYIDATTQAGLNLYEKGKSYNDSIRAGQNNYRDSLSVLAQSYWGINSAQAFSLLQNGIGVQTSGRYLMGTPTDSTPVVTITIPADHSSITEQSLHFPGFIMGVEGNDISVPGNLLKSGYRTELWNDNFQPRVKNSNVHYLSDEFIAPGQITRIMVSYNPRLYDFINGFTIDNLGAPDTLSITKTYNDVPVVATSAQVVTVTPAIHAYPNPNSGQLFVSAEQATEVTVLNTLGESIMALPLQKGTTSLTLPAKGIYFLQTESSVQKIIVE